MADDEIELFEEHIAPLDQLQRQFQGFVNELPQQDAQENRAFGHVSLATGSIMVPKNVTPIHPARDARDLGQFEETERWAAPEGDS